MNGSVTLFFASISIVCAAVLGLAGGVLLGARLTLRLMGGFKKLFDKPEYRTTAGAVWALHRVETLCKGGASVDEIGAFVQAEGDRIAARIQEGAGPDILEAIMAPDAPKDDQTTPKEDEDE